MKSRTEQRHMGVAVGGTGYTGPPEEVAIDQRPE